MRFLITALICFGLFFEVLYSSEKIETHSFYKTQTSSHSPHHNNSPEESSSETEENEETEEHKKIPTAFESVALINSCLLNDHKTYYYKEPSIEKDTPPPKV